MSKVSKYPLDKTIEKEIFQQFWRSVSQLRDASEVSSFFSDLLTDTEELMLAKRFAIAILLIRGKRPVDIVPTIHVTYTTVGSVAAWVKNAKPKTHHALERISHERNWQSVVDRIDELLDVLPTRYGSNWSRAGRERGQRRNERSARQALR